MPDLIEKTIKRGQIPPIKNNLAEQINIFRNSIINMNKSGQSLT
jgi:hypothetical protein